MEETQQLYQKEENTPPSLSVSTTKVYVNTDFAITIAVGSKWRQDSGITTEDLWRAGLCADIVLERDTSIKAGPCHRCSPTSRSVVQLGLSGKTDFGPFSDPNTPGIERFRFDHCRSKCSSSRLHLGSRVIVALKLPRCVGVPPVLFSRPFELLSKKPHSMRGGNFRVSPLGFKNSPPSYDSSAFSTVPPSPEEEEGDMFQRAAVSDKQQSPEAQRFQQQQQQQQLSFALPSFNSIANIQPHTLLSTPLYQQQPQQQSPPLVQPPHPTLRRCNCFLCGRPVFVSDSMPSVPLPLFALSKLTSIPNSL